MRSGTPLIVPALFAAGTGFSARSSQPEPDLRAAIEAPRWQKSSSYGSKRWRGTFARDISLKADERPIERDQQQKNNELHQGQTCTHSNEIARREVPIRITYNENSRLVSE